MSDEPPHPDAGSDDSDSSDQPKIVVDDPEDFARTRQLRAIFDARDEYIQQRREANELLERGEIQSLRRNKHVFRHVQDFAMTMEPLLKSSDSGMQIWEESKFSINSHVVAADELATVADAKQHLIKKAREHVSPEVRESELRTMLPMNADLPDSVFERLASEFGAQSGTEAVRVDGGQMDAQTVQNLSSGDPLKTNLRQLTGALQQQYQARQPDPNIDYNRLIRGLLELVEDLRRHQRRGFKQAVRIAATDWGWTAEGVQEIVQDRCKLAFPKDPGFGRSPPPQEISDEVFRELNGYIDELGLGVQFGEEQQTKIDDETLRELDQWRKENIN